MGIAANKTGNTMEIITPVFSIIALYLTWFQPNV